MIRSAGVPSATEWKTLPSGFRVVRRPCGVQPVRRQKRHTFRNAMVAPDMLQMGLSALWWKLKDRWHQKRTAKLIVWCLPARLPASA
ncbi:hypothetical protein [Sphingomonas endolithica]|uniref:hypothetical protein n=1 Tax=Sphingomonas endolithica TaxID=2972485 RepID=UPI0021AF03BE|nr:hypothetical protein [Sphingomonas sp. ZFBP2030]